MAEPVDWNLLPADPEKFFGLPPTYDRKDLKKRYHQLVKQFKPERSPVEFQRIRAAFEQLDERLRYQNPAMGSFPSGIPIGFRPEVSHELPPAVEDVPTWNFLAEEQTVGPTSKSEQPLTEQPLIEQPLTEQRQTEQPRRDKTPTRIYGELLIIGPDSPEDFIRLAFLSDFVEPHDEMCFADWLLKGLQKFPTSSRLFHLLHVYCRFDLSINNAIDFIPRLAAVVQGSAFYFLTECVWLRLLESLPFEQFAEMLEDCEKQLTREDNVARVVFLSKIVTAACWKSSLSWLLDKVAFWEANSLCIQQHDDLNLDLLQYLIDYRRGRPRFLNGSPVRARFDQTLRAYFELSDYEAAMVFLEFQRYLRDNPEQVLDAFPLRNAVFEPARVLMDHITWEMESFRQDGGSRDQSCDNSHARVLAFIQERETRWRLSSLCWNWGLPAINIGQVFLLVIPIVLFYWYDTRAHVLVVGWLIFWFGLWFPTLRVRMSVWLVVTCSRHLYLRCWRQAAIRLTHAVGIEPEQLVRSLQLIDEDQSRISRILSRYLANDYALGLVSRSQSFL